MKTVIEKTKKILKNNFIIIFILYYCTVFMDITSLEVDYQILEKIVKVLRYGVYLLCVGRIMVILPEYKKDIFNTKWREKSRIIKFSYLLIIVMAISLLVNFAITSNRRMIFLFLMLVASYKTDYRKIIKTTMMLQIILTSVIVMLSITGVTQNYIVPRGQIRRYSLGFKYTTQLAQMVLFSTVLHLYSVEMKVKVREIFIIQLLNLLTFFVTNSRAEFILLEIILIITGCNLFSQKSNKKNIMKTMLKRYSKFFSYSFIVYPLLSFVLVFCYKFGGIWYKLNALLSNRLKQTYDNIVVHGLKIFGDNIEFKGFGLDTRLEYGNSYASNFIDNEYIQMLFNEGILFTICFIILINVLLIILYRKRCYKEIVLCSVFLLFGIINNRIINIAYCPILFILIPTLFNFDNKEDKVNL